MDLKQLSDEVEHVSRAYAGRFGIERDATWRLLKLHEEVGELTQSFLMMNGQARAKGRSPEEVAEAFRREIADVLCQTLADRPLPRHRSGRCSPRQMVGMDGTVGRRK